VYELFFENPPSKDYLVVQTSSYDNLFLPDGYVSSMEDAYDEDWTRRYLQGLWFDFEGFIYPEFSREVHLGDFRHITYNDYFGGLDFGFRNPACFLLIARDSDDNLIICDELYQSGLTNSELAVKILELVKPVHQNFQSIFCDPSAPATIEEIGKYVYCQPANNDVISGISVVKNRFKQKTLFIDQGCTHLIKELESYQYEKDSKNKDATERPLKKNDHAVDALRYGCMGIGESGTFKVLFG